MLDVVAHEAFLHGLESFRGLVPRQRFNLGPGAADDLHLFFCGRRRRLQGRRAAATYSFALVPGVVVDPTKAEAYVPETQTGASGDLAFDLAAVESVQDATKFVETWGFLRTPPESGRTSEEAAVNISEAQRVRAILTMYADLLKFVEEEGDKSDLARWRDALQLDGDPEPALMAAVAGRLVNNALGHTPLRVVVNPQFGEPGQAPFLASIGATDLLGYVYFHVATLMMGSTPVRECATCHRPFEATHPNKLYCTERCASRARQRRFAAKEARIG